METFKIANYLLIDAAKGSRIELVSGIDSYSGRIITDRQDTFDLEYGRTSIIYDGYDPGPAIWNLAEKDSLLKNLGVVPSVGDVIFSKTPEQDKSQNIFDKQYYLYDSTNNIVKKIIQPKVIGDGKVGMYVHSLKNGQGFIMYAKNLDSVSQRNAIDMFKSFRYNQ